MTENHNKEKFFENDRYNKRLTKAFLAVAAVGFAITIPAEMSRIFNEVADINIFDNDVMRYYMGHGKNFGQAIYYTQIAHLGISQWGTDKAFREKQLDKTKMSDLSFQASSLIMASGFVWEKYSEVVKGQSFDWSDMKMYAAGCALLIGMNKLAKNLTDCIHAKREQDAKIEKESESKPPYPVSGQGNNPAKP